MDPLEKLSTFQPARKAMSLFDEFKNFAFKGRVIDLAVGVIIGTAFGKIVESLVKQIIMPILGLMLPGHEGYLGWKWVINGTEVAYGQFLGEVINFLIISLALFLFAVKFLGWLAHERRVEAVTAPPLTKEQELLTEIRDLLRKSAGSSPIASGP